MANIHPFDDAVEEVLAWLTDETDYYVEALKAGHQTPFAAGVSEDQKLDYYKRQVFQIGPDGEPNYHLPNEAGRNALIDRVGLKGYAEIMARVMPGLKRRIGRTEDLPTETPEYPGEGSE